MCGWYKTFQFYRSTKRLVASGLRPLTNTALVTISSGFFGFLGSLFFFGGH